MSRLQYMVLYLLPGFFFWGISQYALGTDLFSRLGQLVFGGAVLLQYRLSPDEQRGSVLLHGLGIYLYAVYLLPPAIPGLLLWTLLALFLFLPGALFIGYPYRHPVILLVLLGGMAGMIAGLRHPEPFWLMSEHAPFEQMPYLALLPAAYMVWKESGHFFEMIGTAAGLLAVSVLAGQLERTISGPCIALLIIYFALPFRSRYPGFLRPFLAGLLCFFLFLPSLYLSFWFRYEQSTILWPLAVVFVLQDWLSAPLHRLFRRAMF